MTDSTLLHDEDAAGLDLAIACRLLHHFKHAVDRAMLRGADLTGLPVVNWPDLESMYLKLVDQHLTEVPQNPLQVAALHRFATFALLDEQLGKLSGAGPIVTDDKNRAEAISALLAIKEFVDDAEIGEAVDRGRKAPLPAGSHGNYILDQMRAALDRIAAGKGDIAAAPST